MALRLTSLLGLNTYATGDRPGAGSQIASGHKGVNHNPLLIDTALGTGHNADGSHKNAVIHKANLSNDVADGVTLEQDGANKWLQVKAGGIGTTQLADDAVTAVKIAAGAVGQPEIADDAVGTGEIIDGSVTGPKIADNTITADKLATDLAMNGISYLFVDSLVADVAAGSDAAAGSEWQETAAVQHTKIRGRLHIPKEIASATKLSIVLAASAKNDNTKGWKVELVTPGTTVTATDVNTAYDGTTQEVDLAVQLSDGVSVVGNDLFLEWSVTLGVQATVTTAYLSKVVVALIAG